MKVWMNFLFYLFRFWLLNQNQNLFFKNDEWHWLLSKVKWSYYLSFIFIKKVAISILFSSGEIDWFWKWGCFIYFFNEKLKLKCQIIHFYQKSCNIYFILFWWNWLILIMKIFYLFFKWKIEIKISNLFLKFLKSI
jgi:hypothetical protein